MVDARNLGVGFFCSSGIGSVSLSKFGCVPFLFSNSSPKNPRAGLFVLSYNFSDWSRGRRSVTPPQNLWV
ncbi:hypothetical protein TNCV_4161901 [Trichonephila clavipes]|nr:hypothetical protein TNCV_4161901 [Trichonephila clavipes]